MIATTKVRAEIKFLAIYVCSKCSSHAQGTTDGFQFEGGSLEELTNRIASAHRVPNCMPIGWAHFGDGDYRCAKCL